MQGRPVNNISPLNSNQLASCSNSEIDEKLLRSSLVRDNGQLAVRDNHEATWCLLFVDLFFIAFSIQVSHSLRNGIEHAVLLDYPSAAAYTIFINFFVFLCYFCIWVDTQIFFTRVPLASVRDLLLFMFEMLGAFCIVLGVNSATATETSQFGIEWDLVITGLMISRMMDLISWALWWWAQSDEYDNVRAHTSSARVRATLVARLHMLHSTVTTGSCGTAPSLEPCGSGRPQDEWVFCQWTVRVKCGVGFGYLAIWGSHYLRNLLFGMGGLDPQLHASSEVVLAFAIAFLAVLELLIRAAPGSPGQIISMETLREGAWQELMRRCGDVTILLLGEPIISIGGASSVPQCEMLTSHSSRFVALGIIFSLALLYFGSQPTCLKRHILARSVPGSLCWLSLHGLLGFTLLAVSSALSIGLQDVNAARAGLGVCRNSQKVRFCECFNNRTECLDNALQTQGSQRCAWVACSSGANLTEGSPPPPPVEFCAAFLPGASSSSCFLEVARTGGNVAQFFSADWRPFPFVAMEDPRAAPSFWAAGNEDARMLVPGGAGHHGGRGESTQPPSDLIAGPELWPWMLGFGLVSVNLEIFLLRAMHKDVDLRDSWRSLSFRLLLCALPWVVCLNIESKRGSSLLCNQETHSRSGFKELVSFYLALLAMQLTLVGLDVFTNIHIRREIERKAKDVRHLRHIAGVDDNGESGEESGRSRALSRVIEGSEAEMDSALSAFALTQAPQHVSIYFSQKWGPAVYRMTPGFRLNSLRGSALHASVGSSWSSSSAGCAPIVEARECSSADRRSSMERRLCTEQRGDSMLSRQTTGAPVPRLGSDRLPSARLGSGRLSTSSLRSARQRSVKFEDEVESGEGAYQTEPDTRESSCVPSRRL